MIRPWVPFCVSVIGVVGTAQTFHPSFPKAWDDREITAFELPLAKDSTSPPVRFWATNSVSRYQSLIEKL